MSKSKQQSFEKISWRHRYSHGGSLRQERAGRSARPLSSRDSLHLVFKANREVVRGGFRQSRRFAVIHHLVQKYKFKFYVKVEQISVQGDHLHLLIRTTRRSNYQSFFRVVAGQIAQQFEKEGLLTVAVTDTPKAPARLTAGAGSMAGGGSMETRLAGSSSEQQRVREKTGENSLLQNGPRSAAPRKQRENFEVTDTPGSPAKPETRGSGSHYHMEVKANSNGQGSLTQARKKLWKYRPFTRVVKGYHAYTTVRDYIQLNEKEAIGEIRYQKRRLKGLSSSEWEVLWA